MNLSELLFNQNWFLSAIFILLFSISIASWYVIFKKIFFFNRELKSLTNGDKNSFSQQLISQSIEAIRHSEKEIISRKLYILNEEFREKISFGQNFLASVANLTPFIGLFGTVIGVYLALIDISNEGSANIAVVAAPIGEALIATAIGLWCAIPASFAYNFFAKKISTIIRKTKVEIEKKLIEKEF
jgi:biopolymer transport protein ExbB/TolQ